MFAPIRPSPIVPSCMASSSRFPSGAPLRLHAPEGSGPSPELAVAPDQRVGRAVVARLRLFPGFELRDDPLRQRLPQLHTPLVAKELMRQMAPWTETLCS